MKGRSNKSHFMKDTKKSGSSQVNGARKKDNFVFVYINGFISLYELNELQCMVGQSRTHVTVICKDNPYTTKINGLPFDGYTIAPNNDHMKDIMD